MATITFDGDMIWESADGSYDFTPSMMSRRWMHVTMLRTDGEIAKPGGLSGCDHSLVLRFHDIAVAGIAAVFTAMKNLSTSIAEGVLSTPDYGSYPNCVCKGVVPSKQTAGLKNLQPDLDNDKCYLMEFTITFRQARP